MAEVKSSLLWPDWVVIGFYFMFTIGIGLVAKLRKRNREETTESYFLAGRSLVWWMVGGSLFASNIGGTQFIGVAGDAAATGIAVVAYEWQASWILLLLGYLFVPVYLKGGIYTMPEFLQKRYKSSVLRGILTFIALISYVFTKISVDMYAGSLYFNEATGWSIYLSSFIVLSVTAVYVILGGLQAVTYTDVLQCTIMLIGALVLTAMAFSEVGGINALWEKFEAMSNRHVTALGKNITTMGNMTVNGTMVAFGNMTMNGSMTNVSSFGNDTINSCYSMTPYWSNMFRPASDSEYPWIGLWVALPIIGIWYWCTDQVIVQRVLGAKSVVHAKGGTIFAGFLKVLPMFIMVMPGMISRVLYPDSVGCSDPVTCKAACGNELGCSNAAYPKLVFQILPTGMVGLMMAVMLAAVMSSLSSVYNSSSTIFTIDIWQKFIRKQASEREKVIVGRIVVVILVILGLLWLPLIDRGGGGRLFKYIQTIQMLLGAPVMAVFSVGILWHRANEAGGLAGLITGFILGMARFIAEYVHPTPACNEIDNRPLFASMNFMYFGIILFFVSVFIIIIVSLMTKPIPLNDLAGLTWKTLHKKPTQAPESPDQIEMAVGEEHAMMTKDTNSYTVTWANAEPNGTVNTTVGNAQLAENDENDVLFQTRKESIFLNCGTAALLFTLAFLWIWYR